MIFILFHWEINVNNVSCVNLCNFCSMFSKWRGPHLKRQSSAKLYCSKHLKCNSYIEVNNMFSLKFPEKVDTPAQKKILN